MKAIKFITAMASLVFASTGYSEINFTSQADRVLIKEDYLILANEPGLITCPNVNCDIPVDLKAFRKEEDKYIPVSSINSSIMNSSNHTLYQYNDKIINSYSTRRQLAQGGTFKTHLKSFDFSSPENPSLLANLEFGGSLLASNLNNNRLVNLSRDTIENNNSNSFGECSSLRYLSGSKRNNSDSFLLRIIDTPLENIKESRQNCLILEGNGIKNSAIKSTKNSIYITFLDDHLKRYVIRYKNENGSFIFDNKIALDDDVFSKHLGNYIQESEDTLMILGNYKFYKNTQAGIKVFDLVDNEIIISSETNISLTTSEDLQSSITSSSEAINNYWPIAVLSNEAKNENQLYNVDITNPSTPYAASSISIPGNIERIIPMPNNLLSVYTRQLKFLPVTSLSIIDISNTQKSHLVYSELLTEDFTHQPLAIVDKLTQNSLFKNQHSGKLVIPLEKTLDSPFSMDTSLAGSNSERDVPSKRQIDLISVDFFKHDHCIATNKSCWIAEKLQTDTIILPYEGDEPSRARLFINNKGYYYVLGKKIQFFPYQ
jgi:hypothetical protein